MEAAPERLAAAVFDEDPEKLTVADSEAEGEGEPDGGTVREAKENDGTSEAVGGALPVAPPVADTSTVRGAVGEGDPEKQPEEVVLNEGLPLEELAGLEVSDAVAQPEEVTPPDAVWEGLVDALGQLLPVLLPAAERDGLGLPLWDTVDCEVRLPHDVAALVADTDAEVTPERDTLDVTE